jgi:hypothetical protein
MCYVGFINFIGVVAGVRRHTSSIYWAQLSRFHMKTEAESSLHNVVLNKRQDDG